MQLLVIILILLKIIFLALSKEFESSFWIFNTDDLKYSSDLVVFCCHAI